MTTENLEMRINKVRGDGHALSDTVREPMEKAFGADFNDVRVHTDPEADALNQQLSAKAFTAGQDVFFREGEYSPGSDKGRKLIAHELTHVVQQTSGQVTQRINRIKWKFWKKKKKKKKTPFGGVSIIPPPVPKRGRRRPKPAPAVVPVLTPQDNFAGRSKARFGVGEEVNLDFRTNPAGKSAASFGGLNWTVAGGNATVINTGNTGIGVLTVGSQVANLTLQLKRAGGKKAGQVEASRNIPVVAPTDAHMEQHGGGFRHYQGYPSAGFLGDIFLHPKDVSFKWGHFKEGYGQAQPTGEFVNQAWALDPHLNVARGPGSMKKFTWVNIKGGSRKGSQMDGADQVFSGALSAKLKYPQPTEFTWNIPWFYQCKNPDGPVIQLPNPAVHHATCNAAGAMSIEKKGAGPFTIAKNAADSEW